jgi:dUTP pyrophosphatase
MSRDTMKVAIKRLHADAKHPMYQTEHSAGMDLEALIDAPLTLAPHERAVIPTGYRHRAAAWL